MARVREMQRGETEEPSQNGAMEQYPAIKHPTEVAEDLRTGEMKPAVVPPRPLIVNFLKSLL